MKVVVDTNVFVSALIRPGSIPAQILSHPAPFMLVTSEEILAELGRVFQYQRIQRRYNLSPEMIRNYILNIRLDSEVIQVARNVSVVAQDPDDDKFLACAEEASADFIVSGDPHLTVLESHKGIPILTPRQFFDLLASQKS
jgi:putative PIN family toxin of toxin-antitoxin system